MKTILGCCKSINNIIPPDVPTIPVPTTEPIIEPEQIPTTNDTDSEDVGSVIVVPDEIPGDIDDITPSVHEEELEFTKDELNLILLGINEMIDKIENKIIFDL